VYSLGTATILTRLYSSVLLPSGVGCTV
jgi:hypothetical protein